MPDSQNVNGGLIQDCKRKNNKGVYPGRKCPKEAVSKNKSRKGKKHNRWWVGDKLFPKNNV
jgi:hypothetical protein